MMKRHLTVILMALVSFVLYGNNVSCNLTKDKINLEAETLLQEWVDTLLTLQYESKYPTLDGGIICPACARIHGRIGDFVLPLMYMADKTGDDKYLNAAKRLIKWMETVRQPDGSWMNDVNVSDWNGTTVFFAIALGEAVKYHGHLLDEATLDTWKKYLESSGEFILNNRFIYSRKREGMRNMNVNYSASATYALYLLGDIFEREDFKNKAKEIAFDLRQYFTKNDCFLFGEGPNITSETKNGCRPVDLLYNVEESLPNMAHYALLSGDKELEELIVKSMNTHLEFMLPDGAWDNSWGTRSFKWTYWGGRTSDGFMGGYGLMSTNHPEYMEAIYRNIKLLRNATHNGLLFGGLHYNDLNIQPCIHHTFGHSKALTSFLECKVGISNEAVTLPRDKEYGVKFFKDIRTWLVSEGQWRATVTGYDAEYKVKGTHPMGGVLSMLWHEKFGPIFASTTNMYKMIEAPNMQHVNRKYIVGGSPRLEFIKDGKLYSNLDDLDTDVIYTKSDNKHIFKIKTHLVTCEQESPSQGVTPVDITYIFDKENIIIEAESTVDGVSLVLPVIASKINKTSLHNNRWICNGNSSDLEINVLSGNLSLMPVDSDGRAFNPVPGFAMVPLKISFNRGSSKISVLINVCDNIK